MPVVVVHIEEAGYIQVLIKPNLGDGGRVVDGIPVVEEIERPMREVFRQLGSIHFN